MQVSTERWALATSSGAMLPLANSSSRLRSSLDTEAYTHFASWPLRRRSTRDIITPPLQEYRQIIHQEGSK
nr:MAG TPA: hypothetical protein [Caudoviricetes sp.]